MQTSATVYKRKEKLVYAYVAQMVRAVGSYPTDQWFDSTRRYQWRGHIFFEVSFVRATYIHKPLTGTVS